MALAEQTAPLDVSVPTLVQPSNRIRYRAAGGGGRRGAGGPEYPPVALPVDYLPAGFKETSRWRSAMRRVASFAARLAAPGRGGDGWWTGRAAAVIRTIPTCAVVVVVAAGAPRA